MPSSFIFQFTLLALIILHVHSDVTTEEETPVNSVTPHPEYPDLEHPVHVTWNKGKTLLNSWRDGTGTSKGKRTVRGALYDCLMLDLHNCPNRSIDVTWKKDNILVAKMKGRSVKSYGTYSKRFRAFPNGSLSLCPMQPDDEGQYTAEVFSWDGTHLCHQTIQLEYSRNKTASIQEVMGILDGSMFLHLTVTEWNDLVQITWKKDGLLVAELNDTQLESHGGYNNRSEILPNGTLRLDRIQKSDCGRYSVEVQDRDGKIIYRRMIDVKVDSALEMPALTVDHHLLLFIIIGVLGVVFIVVLGSLIWHFEKCRQRTGHFWLVPGAHSGYNEDLVESGVGGTNSPDQEGTGNPASQEPEAANSTKQENEAFIKNAEETKAATAASLYTERPMSLNISTFQGIEGPKSQSRPMHAGNDVASVTKDYVLPEYGNYVPQDDRDYVPRDFDEYLLPRFDDCGPPEFDECPPPDFGDCSPPDFNDCVLSEFDDDDGPPEFDDIALPEFDDCGPPEFDDIALPEFDDCGPPDLDDPMEGRDYIPVVNGMSLNTED